MQEYVKILVWIVYYNLRSFLWHKTQDIILMTSFWRYNKAILFFAQFSHYTNRRPDSLGELLPWTYSLGLEYLSLISLSLILTSSFPSLVKELDSSLQLCRGWKGGKKKRRRNWKRTSNHCSIWCMDTNTEHKYDMTQTKADSKPQNSRIWRYNYINIHLFMHVIYNTFQNS